MTKTNFFFFLILIVLLLVGAVVIFRKRAPQPLPPVATSEPKKEFVTFILPPGWIQVPPDPSVQSPDEKVTTLEFAKENESRSYPVGRITLQHSKTDQLNLPEAVFAPTNETINDITFQVLGTTEADGQAGNFSAQVYTGQTVDPKEYLRFLIRYQSDQELSEERAVLSTFQFTP